jgi:hypothetical protein
MAMYFFDTFENGVHVEDDRGLECGTPEQVRAEAMKALPAIAKDEIPNDGDRQAFTVLVKDEAGRPVYSATLTYAGLWLEKKENE